jgi:hydroxypyruvate isomerase
VVVTGRRKLAANIGMLFTEFPLERRFEAAAAAGFAAIECGNPYVLRAGRYRQLLESAGLRQVLVNSPAGPPGSPAELGWGCLPEHVPEFRASVERALEYAVALDCPLVHLRSGLLPSGMSAPAGGDLFVHNARWAAERASSAGVRLTIEAFNPHDSPGYLIATQEQAAAIVTTVGTERTGVQVDVYHCHRVGCDAAAVLAELRGVVAHVQIADAPGRAEPGTGDVDFKRVFATLDEIDYQGWIGCEYHPRRSTVEGMAWREKFL